MYWHDFILVFGSCDIAVCFSVFIFSLISFVWCILKMEYSTVRFQNSLKDEHILGALCRGWTNENNALDFIFL